VVAWEVMTELIKRDPARSAAWRSVFVVFVFIIAWYFLVGFLWGQAQEPEDYEWVGFLGGFK